MFRAALCRLTSAGQAFPTRASDGPSAEAPNWSAKVEYLYYDLGSVNLNYVTLSNFVLAFPIAFGPSLGVGASARYSGHIARVGLNYHFNWATPAPVLAKY